jgi:hypothetical protein
MIAHPDGFSIYNNNGRHKVLKERKLHELKLKSHEYIKMNLNFAQVFKLLQSFVYLKGCILKPVLVATSFEA